MKHRAVKSQVFIQSCDEESEEQSKFGLKLSPRLYWANRKTVTINMKEVLNKISGS